MRWDRPSTWLAVQGWELFAPFHQWDIAGQDLTTFVQARSSGFYGNPNELGFWAGAAAIVGWTFLPPGSGSPGSHWPS